VGEKNDLCERVLRGEGGGDESPSSPPGCEPLISAENEGGVGGRSGRYESETNLGCARSEPRQAQLTDEGRLW
ncbi:hypothetical protein JG688_00014763, partial [Phytophthora aleatoria]